MSANPDPLMSNVWPSIVLVRLTPLRLFARSGSEMVNAKRTLYRFERRRSPMYCRKRETIVRVNSAIGLSGNALAPPRASLIRLEEGGTTWNAPEDARSPF
jgi:hypothetical protein